MNSWRIVLLVALMTLLGIGFGCSSEKPEEAAKPAPSATQSQAGPQMQCRDRFTELDVNKDGTVTMIEFSAVPHPGGQAELIFKARDKDANGVLTVEEFCLGKGAGARRGFGAGKQ